MTAPVRMVLMLLVALAGLLPAGVIAHPLTVREQCHAEASARESYASVNLDPRRWTCAADNYSIDSDVVFIRFRLKPDGPLPASFVTHAATFERVDLAVFDRDGAMRSLSYPEPEARHLGSGPVVSVQLPPVTRNSEWIVARVSGPWSKTVISQARLDDDPEGTGWDLGEIVAMAMICGMLVLPLLFNGGFYVILRQQYVLWHLVLITAMLLQALVGTGFIHLIVDLPTFVEGAISTFCYGLIGASALMFTGTFLEPHALDRAVQRGLRLTAAFVFGIGVFTLLPFESLRLWSTLAIYLAMIATIVMLVTAQVHAWRRGSNLVWFQIAGWTPTVLVGVWRIGCYLFPAGHPTDSIVPYELSLAVEVVASSIGIISRIVVLRRERDDATALAQELEGEARRDPLTGLWNRHAIEARFRDLVRDGFRTMAVIDLDHFKAVNDSHGHDVGDKVLKAAAGALVFDADTRAIRMGGEEFLLLLRGPDAAERAERCRRAITTRVAAGVPGLDRMVTASMGLVEHDPRGALRADFATLYRQCDKLLYEAKRLGRNRTMREKMTSFAPDAALAI